MQSVAKRVPETILDAENRIQATLDSLRDLPLSDDLRLGLSFLTRPGYRTVVQLEEDGRKKRSTAAASNWNPDSGEVVIFFERVETMSGVASVPISGEPRTEQAIIIPAGDTAKDAQQIKECCDALATAEKAGKAFVALKLFRDEVLPTQELEWTSNAEDRQRVLSRAIEQGAIRTSRVPNPKNPQFPTTAISLNHDNPSPAVKSRFNPIPIKGEPMSATILRDRGSY